MLDLSWGIPQRLWEKMPWVLTPNLGFQRWEALALLGAPSVFLDSVINDNNDYRHHRVGTDRDALFTVLGTSHVSIYLIFPLPMWRECCHYPTDTWGSCGSIVEVGCPGPCRQQWRDLVTAHVPSHLTDSLAYKDLGPWFLKVAELGFELKSTGPWASAYASCGYVASVAPVLSSAEWIEC